MNEKTEKLEDSGAADNEDDSRSMPDDVRGAIRLAEAGTDDKGIPLDTDLDTFLGDLNLTGGCQDKNADMRRDLSDEAKEELWGNKNENLAGSGNASIGPMEAAMPVGQLETKYPDGQHCTATVTIDLGQDWLNLGQDTQPSRPEITMDNFMG